MTSYEWRIGAGADAVRAIAEPATSGGVRSLFVFAHGAGGHMSDRGMVAATAVLRDRGLDVVRFNFPYRAKGSSRPDPMPRLQQCIAEVASRVRSELDPKRLILGGRSMGGRAASMLAAAGFSCDALLLLAYPLHPAGQPDRLRDTHLQRIACPVLCLNGTRDALCRRDLMDAVVARLSSDWHMHWIEGADHSFHVTRASGRTGAEVLDEIGCVVGAWHPESPARQRSRTG